MKLHEDSNILSHRAQRANEPGQVGEEVLPLDGVEEDLLGRSVSAHTHRPTLRKRARQGM